MVLLVHRLKCRGRILLLVHFHLLMLVVLFFLVLSRIVLVLVLLRNLRSFSDILVEVWSYRLLQYWNVLRFDILRRMRTNTRMHVMIICIAIYVVCVERFIFDLAIYVVSLPVARKLQRFLYTIRVEGHSQSLSLNLRRINVGEEHPKILSWCFIDLVDR